MKPPSLSCYLSCRLIPSSALPLFFLIHFLCSFLILPSKQTSKPLLSSVCACDCEKNDAGSNNEENAYAYLSLSLSLSLSRSLSLGLVYLSIMDWSGLVAKSCLTLCNPMECSSPGSSVHEISQARILAWVAVSFPKGSS